MTSVGIAGVLAALAFLQAAAQPSERAFEVASVKLRPLNPGQAVFRIQRNTGPGFEIKGNRVTEQMATLSTLMMDAYGVKAYQIIGLPDWGPRGSTVFDVEAKCATESPSVDQVRAMLQTLLAERFELKLHREQRDLPVYDLVIAKSGPKLKETVPPERSASSSSASFSRTTISKTMTSTVPMLITLLSNLADRPIIDQTGLTATYEYENLDWAGIRRAQSATTDGGEPVESIFTAVQEKLGLKLEPAKSATEVLVVDHATKPSAN